MLHRTGWSARLDRDGTLHVTNPNGNTWTTRPPLTDGRPPPGDRPPLIEHLEHKLERYLTRVVRDTLDGTAA